MYECGETTFKVLEYAELEKLIEKKYGCDYSVPAKLECGNDVAVPFYNVGDKYDVLEAQDSLKRYYEDDHSRLYPGDFLNLMVADGVLAPGHYLINVCW